MSGLAQPGSLIGGIRQYEYRPLTSPRDIRLLRIVPSHSDEPNVASDGSFADSADESDESDGSDDAVDADDADESDGSDGSDESDDDIHIEIIHSSLDSPNLSYQALSYVWGTDSKDAQAYCNGQELHTTQVCGTPSCLFDSPKNVRCFGSTRFVSIKVKFRRSHFRWQ